MTDVRERVEGYSGRGTYTHIPTHTHARTHARMHTHARTHVGTPDGEILHAQR